MKIEEANQENNLKEEVSKFRAEQFGPSGFGSDPKLFRLSSKFEVQTLKFSVEVLR